MHPGKSVPRGSLTAAAILMAVLGVVLSGHPLEPSQSFGWKQEAGAFCTFLFWIASLLSWGDLLFHALKLRQDRGLLVPGLGSAWAFGTAMILGHAGLAGHDSSLFWKTSLTLGILLHPWFCSSWRVPALPRGLAAWCFGVTIFSWILMLMAASTLQFFQDPLWYHLVGPRLWFDLGKVYQPDTQLVAFKSGSWEYLYMWGNALLGGPGGRGLVAGHFFGQWVHVGVGFGGSLIALWKVARFLIRDEKESVWIWLCVLGGMTSYTMGFTAALAKNDWGVIFWSLSGIFLLFSSEQSRSRHGMAGLFLGLAFSGKFTVGFTVLPFLAAWIWTRFRGNRLGLGTDLLWASMGFGMGAAPILIRNAMLIGNPFFPAMGSYFHHAGLGPTWIRTLQEEFETGLSKLTFYQFFVRTTVFLGDSISLVGIILGPWVLQKSRSKHLRPWWIALVVSFLFFFFGTGEVLENRLLGPSNTLGALLGMCLIGLGVMSEPRLARSVRNIQIVLLSFLIFSGQDTFKSAVRFFEVGPPSAQLKHYEGWSSMLWARENLKPNEGLLLAEEYRTYYLTGLKSARIFDYPEMDKQLAVQKTLISSVDLFLSMGFTHLLEVATTVYDDYLNPELCKSLMQAISRHQDSIAFREIDEKTGNTVSMIVNLSVLSQAIKSEIRDQ